MNKKIFEWVLVLGFNGGCVRPPAITIHSLSGCGHIVFRIWLRSWNRIFHSQLNVDEIQIWCFINIISFIRV